MNFRQELGRKAFHLVAAAFPFLLIWQTDAARLILTGYAIATTTVEIARRLFPGFGRFFLKVFGSIMRDRERDHLTGAFWMSIGYASVAWFFSARTAAVAIGISVFADAAASLIGKRWGRLRWRDHSLEGALAFLVVALVVARAGGVPWMPALTVAGLTAIVESAAVPPNDNVTIPWTAALVLTALSLG